MLESTRCKETFTVGTSADYSVTLRFFRAEDLKVYLGEDLLTLDREYRILPSENYLTGGTLRLLEGTLKIPRLSAIAGTQLTVKRELSLVQQLSLPEHGKLPSGSLEKQLDKLTMIAQQLYETLSRCLVVRSVCEDVDNIEISKALQKLAEHAESYLDVCQRAYDLVSENLVTIQATPEAARSTVTAAAEIKKLLAEIDTLDFLESFVAIQDFVSAAESAANHAESAANRASAASCNGVDLILGDRLADESANAILRYGERLVTD